MKVSIPSIIRSSALCTVLFLLTSAFSTAQTLTDWWMVSSEQGEQQWNSLGGSLAFRYWANSPSVSNWAPDTDWDEETQAYTWDSRYAKAMDPTATYHVAGSSTSTKDIRTAGNTNPDNFTFQGGKLILENQYTRLLIRTSDANVSTIVNLESKGGQLRTSVNNNKVHNLNIGTFRITGEVATSFGSSSGDSNRTFNLTIGTLIGEGDIAFNSESGTSKYTFSIGDASGYTGNFLLTVGELTFTSSFETAGGLELTSGTFHLTNDLTVGTLSISGTGLAAGTYSAADLANHASEGLSIDGSAFLTVIPEPAQIAFVFGSAVIGFIIRRRR